MRERNAIIIIGIVLLGFGLLIFASMEHYAEEVDLGMSAAARKDPYLAAEQYLEKNDTTIDSAYQLGGSETLSTDSVVVVTNSNDVLDSRRADQLMEWLESGGHVIIAAPMLSAEKEDVFLARFGIEKYTDEVDIDLRRDVKSKPGEEEPTVGDKIREAQKLIDEKEKEREDREQAKNEGRLKTVADEIKYREEHLNDDRIVNLRFDNLERGMQIFDIGGGYLDHPSLYLDDDEDYDGYKPFYWQGTAS